MISCIIIILKRNGILGGHRAQTFHRASETRPSAWCGEFWKAIYSDSRTKKIQHNGVVSVCTLNVKKIWIEAG